MILINNIILLMKKTPEIRESSLLYSLVTRIPDMQHCGRGPPPPNHVELVELELLTGIFYGSLEL